MIPGAKGEAHGRRLSLPEPPRVPGWFGGAIDRCVADLVEQFGDALPGLWVEVWIYARKESDGWILRDVRLAGPEPVPWRIPEKS